MFECVSNYSLHDDDGTKSNVMNRCKILLRIFWSENWDEKLLGNMNKYVE